MNHETKDVPPQAGLKLLVACQVGMTGKSTVSANVLHPRLGGRFFSVDSVNQDATQYGSAVEVCSVDELYEMRQEMYHTPEPVVVDLGASDFATFIQQMAGASMARSFNYAVIVTDTSRRGQEEAIATVQTLEKLGMPKDSLRMVLNKAKIGKRMDAQYQVLFNHKRRNPDFPLNPECYLPESQVFRALHESGQSFQEALDDKTEYESRVHEAELNGDTSTAVALGRKAFAQMLAAGMEEYFDNAFKELRLPIKR